MSEDRDSCVWLNGALLAAGLARIDPSDRGLTLGDGIFETIRVAAGVPQQAPRHLARLRRSAEQLGITKLVCFGPLNNRTRSRAYFDIDYVKVYTPDGRSTVPPSAPAHE